MPHYITTRELASKRRTCIASSSEDHKRLFEVVTITQNRFHCDQSLSYEVEHKNEIVHTSDKISLGVKAYNNIQNTHTELPKKTIIKPTTSCTICNHKDKCNKYLRHPEEIVTDCVGFKLES